ncbi:polynucleotide kinase 3 phosphatase-domain-containing protein [Lipomyces orientalis]|uniref:Polynucleotide kinase 3 phosphatase-domain-containing protein n=1 Tax=Lipomyces orientalis TaxID=1233043 RepID=A0ACC3TXS4_9ASCO
MSGKIVSTFVEFQANLPVRKFTMTPPKAFAGSVTARGQQATLVRFMTTNVKTDSDISDPSKNLASTSTSTTQNTRKRHATEDLECEETRTSTKTVNQSDGEIVFEGNTTVQEKGGAKPSAEQIEWTVHAGSVLFGSYHYPRVHSRSIPHQCSTNKKQTYKVAVAGFDLDDTLIVTKTGYRFARNEKDWKFKFGEVKTLKKIKSRLDDSTECFSERVLVIFSNQSGIALAPKVSKSKRARTHVEETTTRLWQFKTKLMAIMKPLGLPCYVIAATTKDEFRKPQVGMWRLVKEAHERHLQHRLNQESKDVDRHVDVELDREHSFFVGDAAGRRGDHSSGDKDFAKNLGIMFYTPEEYFDR